MENTTLQPDFDPSSQPLDAEAIRRKRKAQGQRACEPCRQRKVRCSYETPCQTCLSRGHPELCVYEAPLKRVQIRVASNHAAAAAEETENSTPVGSELSDIHRKLGLLETAVLEIQQSIGQLTATMGRLATSDLRGQALDTAAGQLGTGAQLEGIYTNADMTGGTETVYLGARSVPAMAMELSKGRDNAGDVLRNIVLPMFGLDNETATYPFLDLWGLPHGSPVRIQQLCAILPKDADCLEYFRYYRDTAHVIFPAIIDIDHFESDLTSFLILRDSDDLGLVADEEGKQEVYGKNLHWLGLLFAALASGCQCSALSRKERQLTSQVYVCCAYECLRIVNYLSHSTPFDIQNLLILGNVISNSMNAGVAWSLLGLTIRLAQSLGLHQVAPASVAPEVRVQRGNIWWQIVWQDSLLSIIYDRAPPTTDVLTAQRNSLLEQNNLSYADSMRTLCILGLDILRSRANNSGATPQFMQLLEYRDKLRDIVDRSSSHLQNPRSCRSMRDRLEYWNLLLHRSFVTAELCRPVLSRAKSNDSIAETLKQTCIDSLTDTVEAWLGLQKITRFAVYSWAGLHRALSSSLLLGLLGEGATNPRVRRLLDEFIAIMVDIMSGLDLMDVGGPIARSVEALQRLRMFEERREQKQTMAGQQQGIEEDGWMQYSSSSSEGSTPFLLRGTEGTSPQSLVQSVLWGHGYTM
ncbi:hypothetical protein BDV96DRAFT_567048 [Lophiotrema nucula]|uniref:Zn(2)-C6 fungal-type domain-containing protein n=1 Tax=Lophiotrema nucula TaxID=690887 RepID=A0A6A5ZLR0_9PLEO|nr:hypothetical protein BDV96DRAFT_567048 [Lophiotrema nucula]